MSGEKQTILVVDDEKRIREMYTHFLESLGYSVQTCSDGFDAVAAVEGRGEERFAAVLMDLKMAHVDGRTAIDAIRDIDPTLRIIVISGFVDEDEGRDALAKAARVLRKPVDFDELKAALQEVQGED